MARRLRCRCPIRASSAPAPRVRTSEVTAPVVFAGFGVTTPDFAYDDYAGLDVTGKIVAILANAPGTLPSEPRAHFASNEHKLKNAADHGAVGVVTVLGPDDLKRFPWEQAKAYAGQADADLGQRRRHAGTDREALEGGGLPEPAGVCASVRRIHAHVRPGGGGWTQGCARRRGTQRHAHDDLGDVAQAHVESQRRRRSAGQRPRAGRDIGGADRASGSHGGQADRRRRSHQQRRLRQRDRQRHPARSGARACQPGGDGRSGRSSWCSSRRRRRDCSGRTTSRITR